ncbi:hypothetical protein AGR7C_Lc100016 [Agrobacterium deltaense Zutra 3/1]|uniref:Uncharacterized protein n=1 Tax=Agrobacterium deltaense Zutra 3/1 TaxID=1183427 RepID=A0A1S7QQ76_9HYPH|nr:hypothetical protein AGR7C_Lc100016 [Agrobacterium deltaense Zutra 3/1]
MDRTRPGEDCAGRRQEATKRSPSFRLLDHLEKARVANISFRFSFLRHVHGLDHVGAERCQTNGVTNDAQLIFPLAFRILTRDANGPAAPVNRKTSLRIRETAKVGHALVAVCVNELGDTTWVYFDSRHGLLANHAILTNAQNALQATDSGGRSRVHPEVESRVVESLGQQIAAALRPVRPTIDFRGLINRHRLDLFSRDRCNATMSRKRLVGNAKFGRAAPIRLRIDVAALMTKHKVESDGKRFPSHDVLLIVGYGCRVTLPAKRWVLMDTTQSINVIAHNFRLPRTRAVINASYGISCEVVAANIKSVAALVDGNAPLLRRRT